MRRHTPAVYIVIAVSLLSAVVLAQELLYPVPPESLWGKAYQPDIEIDCTNERDDNLSPQLADWESLYDLGFERKIAIRLQGFREHVVDKGDDPWKPLDVTLSDDATLQLLSQALNAPSVQRPGVSDVQCSWSATGPEAHIGVLEIRTTKRRYIVGVSKIGFFLGVWHGCSHQKFESWPLAKTLDLLLQRETGNGLSSELFDRLSGEYTIAQGKARMKESIAKFDAELTDEPSDEN